MYLWLRPRNRSQHIWIDMLRLVTIAVVALSGVLASTTALAVWDDLHQKFSGSYAIYGGAPAPDEARPRSPGDAKVAFSVRGEAAKKLYDAIGPRRAELAPAQTACSNNPQILVRQRDALICRHSPTDGYWCTFGFDLSTGLTTYGIAGGRICEERDR
jgi:hypothetical protein